MFSLGFHFITLGFGSTRHSAVICLSHITCPFTMHSWRKHANMRTADFIVIVSPGKWELTFTPASLQRIASEHLFLKVHLYFPWQPRNSNREKYFCFHTKYSWISNPHYKNRNYKTKQDLHLITLMWNWNESN